MLIPNLGTSLPYLGMLRNLDTCKHLMMFSNTTTGGKRVSMRDVRYGWKAAAHPT